MTPAPQSTMRREVDGGRSIELWELADGTLHRTDGPAKTIEQRHDGVLQSRTQQWFEHGRQHRADGPAEISERLRPDGGGLYLSNEKWFLDGEQHRDDGPAWTSHHHDGSIRYHRWFRHGRFERDDEPAYIDFHDNGRPEKRIWYRNGQIHRDAKPAVVNSFDDGTLQAEAHYDSGQMVSTTVYGRDGSVQREFHCRNGNFHRDGLPARIVYFDDGSVATQEYYVDGQMHRTDGPAAEEWYSGAERRLRAVQYRRNGYLHRSDGPAFAAWRDDGTPWVEQYWIDGRYRRGDDPAVVVFGEDERYAEYWDDDRIVRREGTLEEVRLFRSAAVPESADDTHIDANYIWAEIERIWHRSCLGLRMQPDICFYFSRGQSPEDIDRLLAYFPCRDEVVERIHAHMNFFLDAYPDQQAVTDAVKIWCATLIGQAETMELTDEADKIRRLLADERFAHFTYREVQTRFHEDARDYDNYPVALVINDAVQDTLYSRPDHMHSYGNIHGSSMLREACYQIATWYQLANSLLTPMLIRDYGFDAWADVYRLGAIVHITDDAIMIGHPDPNDQSQPLTITDPATGVTSALHPG